MNIRVKFPFNIRVRCAITYFNVKRNNPFVFSFELKDNLVYF